mgnify:CR=1 FL=1
MAQPPVSSESQEQRVAEFVSAYQSLRAEVAVRAPRSMVALSARPGRRSSCATS